MRNIPSGLWIAVFGLEEGITETEFQAWLIARGIHVPVENISCKDTERGGTGVLLCIPNDTVAELFNWVANGDLIRQSPVCFRPWRDWQKSNTRR